MSRYKLTQASFPPLAGTHGGTGTVGGARGLVEPWTVDHDVGKPLGFRYTKYSVTVMSFQIATPEAPNWFGVSFRPGIRAFDSVNIFCHPHPGFAKMADSDYSARKGNWPKLFRYAEMLGSQMDAAGSDLIFIIPFFTNATYTSTGVFGPNWKDIVEQILAQVSVKARVAAAASALAHRAPHHLSPANRKVLVATGDATASAAAAIGSEAASAARSAPALKHVVLSAFSRGRELMWNVRRNAPGLAGFLREVWDFDGNAGPAPYTSGGVRGILYDQAMPKGPDARSYHVPPERWVPYHHKVVENVHGNVPEMLAWHAATVSRVGKPTP